MEVNNNKLGQSWAKLSTAEVELGLVLIELQLWLNLTKFACLKQNLTMKLFAKVEIMIRITILD